jgi:pimeloyl-ACP methyl ester carboxylesterase
MDVEQATVTHRVDRPGGVLEVHDLTAGPSRSDDPGSPDAPRPLVLAAHGITANALSWQPVAAELARRPAAGPVRFLAPDLRGRAGSRDVQEPWGLGAHVDDLLAVADAFGAERVVLLGHSMGAFIAALAAARHPDRVRAAVLVDGGLAFPTPPGLDVDAALQAVIGPAMARLSMRFADEDAYLDFWREHPALRSSFASPEGEDLSAYLLHDLVPSGSEWVSSCVVDAVRADGADVLADAEVHGAVRAAVAAGVPIEHVWADRGMFDEPQGLYDEDRLAALEVPPAVRLTRVPDVNHYTVVLASAGARRVADAVERALGDD